MLKTLDMLIKQINKSTVAGTLAKVKFACFLIETRFVIVNGRDSVCYIFFCE